MRSLLLVRGKLAREAPVHDRHAIVSLTNDPISKSLLL